ncbi:hypothetical protein AURDEDRAFT_177927 [Auricularia subglabra TFB-10046 SS5]|uniref:Uncharacterized protein n=1 Tax=Auricularia subglabra (strain TFB-10046 / SS5) TaxID=717982 RepID=J0L9F3_AURST|nr:hypothetical protein AURDEDRAFT_177927 [Auricularia subglabra TFB-10046 SS5]
MPENSQVVLSPCNSPKASSPAPLIPFWQRKAVFSAQYLVADVPYHSSYLNEVAEAAEKVSEVDLVAGWYPLRPVYVADPHALEAVVLLDNATCAIHYPDSAIAASLGRTGIRVTRRVYRPRERVAEIQANVLAVVQRISWPAGDCRSTLTDASLLARNPSWRISLRLLSRAATTRPGLVRGDARNYSDSSIEPGHAGARRQRRFVSPPSASMSIGMRPQLHATRDQSTPYSQHTTPPNTMQPGPLNTATAPQTVRRTFPQVPPAALKSGADETKNTKVIQYLADDFCASRIPFLRRLDDGSRSPASKRGSVERQLSQTTSSLEAFRNDSSQFGKSVRNTFTSNTFTSNGFTSNGTQEEPCRRTHPGRIGNIEIMSDRSDETSPAERACYLRRVDCALCKTQYERTFGSLVNRINRALDRPSSRASTTRTSGCAAPTLQRASTAITRAYVDVFDFRPARARLSIFQTLAQRDNGVQCLHPDRAKWESLREPAAPRACSARRADTAARVDGRARSMQRIVLPWNVRSTSTCFESANSTFIVSSRVRPTDAVTLDGKREDVLRPAGQPPASSSWKMFSLFPPVPLTAAAAAASMRGGHEMPSGSAAPAIKQRNDA